MPVRVDSTPAATIPSRKRVAPYLPLTINVLVCFVIYATGIVFASRGYPLAFARSGAAATAASLALSLWDYRRIVSFAAQIEREALVATVSDICTGSGDMQTLAAALDSRLGGRFGRAERFTTAAEACLLVTATLVWGFGDLVLN
jgi:hypothetical protein